MLHEDKEANLIEDFRLLTRNPSRPACFFPDTAEIRTIVKSLVDEETWKSEWGDSSRKNDPPPDFHSESQRLMMEVMRVDDHAFERGGRIINPAAQCVRMREKELREQGVFDSNPDVRLVINSPTDLPAIEDHNYRYYKTNFKRIIKKHVSQIPQYRANHPGFKLIFFVFDESTMYCETKTPNRTITEDEPVLCKPHDWFCDKAFREVFINSGIDYFIWFTPYKWIKMSFPSVKLPIVGVFDCKQIDEKSIEYLEDYMMSVEG